MMGVGETLVALNTKTGHIDGLVTLNEIRGEEWGRHIGLLDYFDKESTVYLMSLHVHIAPGAACRYRLIEVLATVLRLRRYVLVGSAMTHADIAFWRDLGHHSGLNPRYFSHVTQRLVKNTPTVASRVLYGNICHHVALKAA
jgi:hypothetical protein